MCNQREYMEAQIHRIEVDKWCQSERQCSDPGDDFIIDWVHINAVQFREDWDQSLCKDCLRLRQCGYNVLSACCGFAKVDEIYETSAVS